MTTRHTISSADLLYAGKAYERADTSTVAGGRDDGNRGIEMSHVYVMEYGAIAAKDVDGIVDSQLVTCINAATGNMLATAATGALVTTIGSTELMLDVPRNIVWTASAGTPKLNIIGRDVYGKTMVESITITSAGAFSSGMKAFKYVDNLYVTAVLASTISIGTGDRIGLPYHLSSKGKALGLYANGMMGATVDGASAVLFTTGKTATIAGTSSQKDPDVRGTVRGSGTYLADGTKLFSAMMVVDHKGGALTYGPNQATAIT